MQNTADPTSNLDMLHLPKHSFLSKNLKAGAVNLSKTSKWKGPKKQSGKSSHMHIVVPNTTNFNANLLSFGYKAELTGLGHL